MGVIGVCLTGGFPLFMAVDPAGTLSASSDAANSFSTRSQLTGCTAKPIEVKGHDKTVSRYGENQCTRQGSIFSIFVVHNLSPNHSGCE